MTINSRTAAPRPAFGRRASQGQALPSAVTRRAPGQPPAQPSPLPRAAPTQPDSDFDTGRVVARSFSLMGRNAATFLALVAIAAVPNRVLYHLFGVGDQSAMGEYLLSTIVSCVPLYIAVFTGAMNDLADVPVSFGACLSAGLRTKRAFATVLMTVVAVSYLLIVPGTGWAARRALAAPVAIAEEMGMRDALARSRALTAPYFSRIRLLVLLLAALAVSRAFAMLPVWGMPSWDQMADGLTGFLFGNWLFPLLLTTFTAAAGAALYEEIRQAGDAA